MSGTKVSGPCCQHHKDHPREATGRKIAELPSIAVSAGVGGGGRGRGEGRCSFTFWWKSLVLGGEDRTKPDWEDLVCLLSRFVFFHMLYKTYCCRVEFNLVFAPPPSKMSFRISVEES